MQAGCATVVFEAAERSVDVAPEQVSRTDQVVNYMVVWGGQIITVQNLGNSTELEVLSYPLNSRNVPLIQREPTGRFIAACPGFLEPMTYAPGRFVSLAGQLRGVRKGRVEQHAYSHPVVESTQIHLWPVDTSSWRPRFSFGIGIHN